MTPLAFPLLALAVAVALADEATTVGAAVDAVMGPPVCAAVGAAVGAAVAGAAVAGDATIPGPSHFKVEIAAASQNDFRPTHPQTRVPSACRGHLHFSLIFLPPKTELFAGHFPKHVVIPFPDFQFEDPSCGLCSKCKLRIWP